jgi:hypothetical protein
MYEDRRDPSFRETATASVGDVSMMTDEVIDKEPGMPGCGSVVGAAAPAKPVSTGHSNIVTGQPPPIETMAPSVASNESAAT